MLSDLLTSSRYRPLSVASMLCGLLISGSMGYRDSLAQDPLFAADSSKQTAPSRPPDAQEIQLNETAARGGTHLGDALGALTRIKRWQDADRWLKQGIGPINDPALLAEIADRIGADNLLRLATSDQISDEAKAMVTKINQATRTINQSKQRLTAAIDNLDANTIDKRLESARHLLAGGKAAVAALVEAAVADKPTAPREDILRMMLKIGGNGTQAIEQFAIYGRGAMRTHAIEALTRIDRKAALPDLLTALYASDASEAEKEFAAANLPPITQTLPSFDEAKGYLLRDLKRTRRSALKSENDLATTTLWSIEADRKSVSQQRAREIVLAYRDTVDAASRLRRIGDLSPGMSDAVLAADISYRVLIDPDWGTDEQIQAIGNTYGDLVDSAGLSHAIEMALDEDDALAIVGLLRMVGRVQGGSNSQTFLVSGSSRRTPLVTATLSGQPRIRYEAAAAIMRLNPPNSFPGSSHFRRCVAEMSRLENLPQAILIETRSEVALQQEIILSRLGYRTEVIGSVLDLERYIAKGGDLRLVLSKTQLWDIPPVEMIDRVRRMPLGQNVPIVFYGEPAAGIDSNRWNAISRLIEMPATPSAFTDLLMDLDLINRLPEMTAIDRQLFRQQATDFLARS